MTQPVRIGVIGCGSVSEKYLRLAEQMRSPRPRRNGGRLRRRRGAPRMGARRIWRGALHHPLPGPARDARRGPGAGADLDAGARRDHPRRRSRPASTCWSKSPWPPTWTRRPRSSSWPRPAPAFCTRRRTSSSAKTYQTMWQRLHRGDIGRVLLARALYGWAGPWWGRWFYREGGGALFDLGVVQRHQPHRPAGPGQARDGHDRRGAARPARRRQDDAD